MTGEDACLTAQRVIDSLIKTEKEMGKRGEVVKV